MNTVLKGVSDEELKVLAWEYERTTCMLNLHYLATTVLGYKDLGEVHKPICSVVESVNPLFFYLRGDSNLKSIDEVRDSIKNKLDSIKIEDKYKDFFDIDNGLFTRLFLMFRGGFKSTIINIAHCIQVMLINPNIRILIESHKKEDGSEPFLRAIKHHFMANTTFRNLFPEYCPKANKLGQIEWGTKDAVTLPNRSSKCAFPESTIETAGMTTNVTGRHYDLIKGDDLVTKDSVNNETMLQNTRQQYALLQFLFDQPEWGVKDIIGTPYHFADLYNDLRKSQNIVKITIPCRFNDLTPSFPERFSKQGIEDIKNAGGMTNYEFSCQYDLNPVPTEDQTFRPEWFERLGFYYETLPENLKYYMFVDPANKRSRKSDYTAMMVIAADKTGMYYLVDLIRDKLNVEDRTNRAFYLARKYSIKIVNWESVGFQDTDHFILEKKSREFGYSLSVNPIKAGHASKEDRVRGLQPIYERGMIRWPREIMYKSDYHKRNMNLIESLRDEMLMFPKCEFDDLIDCHAQLLQIHTGKARVPKVQEKEDAFSWWQKQVKKPNKSKEFTHINIKSRHTIPARESWR